jgi:hypothetical protein
VDHYVQCSRIQVMMHESIKMTLKNKELNSGETKISSSPIDLLIPASI